MRFGLNVQKTRSRIEFVCFSFRVGLFFYQLFTFQVREKEGLTEGERWPQAWSPKTYDRSPPLPQSQQLAAWWTWKFADELGNSHSLDSFKPFL